MAEKNSPQKAQSKLLRKRQERLAIAIGVGIIAASVVTTLWISGVFGGGKAAPRYQNVTLTDATLRCEERARDAYKGRLRMLTVDDHSTRFDQPAYLYKVFFRAQMAAPKGGAGASDYFINCYVSADSGKITTFDLYEKKESETEAIKQDSGGLFGWPLKR